jgi:hypothetical protein
VALRQRRQVERGGLAGEGGVTERDADETGGRAGSQRADVWRCRWTGSRIHFLVYGSWHAIANGRSSNAVSHDESSSLLKRDSKHEKRGFEVSVGPKNAASKGCAPHTMSQ